MVLDSTIKDESTNPRFYSRSPSAPPFGRVERFLTTPRFGSADVPHLPSAPMVLTWGLQLPASRSSESEPWRPSLLAISRFRFLRCEHTQSMLVSRFLEIRPKQGDWSSLLSEIWPVTKDAVTWPPPATFVIGGRPSIATLMDRWRVGTEVQHSPQL